MAVHAHITARDDAHLHLSRLDIENQIEALIALLDAFDGDPDLEPNGDDEPWLGWAYNGERLVHVPLIGEGDDRECETEHDEDNGDYEPSLGWVTLEGFHILGSDSDHEVEEYSPW